MNTCVCAFRATFACIRTTSSHTHMHACNIHACVYSYIHTCMHPVSVLATLKCTSASEVQVVVRAWVTKRFAVQSCVLSCSRGAFGVAFPALLRCRPTHALNVIRTMGVRDNHKHIRTHIHVHTESDGQTRSP